MDRKSKSPRQKHLSTFKVEGDLKKAFELIAGVFDSAQTDFNTVFRISNTRDWCVNDYNDIKIEFMIEFCNSISFLESYFQRKLLDPNCAISYIDERDRHCFILKTNYERILSFYSYRHWVANWLRKNYLTVIIVGMVTWYFAWIYYGYFYHQNAEQIIE